MSYPFRLTIAASALCAAFALVAAQAQQAPNPEKASKPEQSTPEQQQQMWQNMQRGGYGPGMMGGYGQGCGMGPGMMHGYGPGYGMGSGMMGGYGPGYGMGPGMMHGYGRGYGMGSGMMGGYGPGYGMGSGLRGAWAGLDLTDAQSEQLEQIHGKLRDSHRTLMPKIWEEQMKLDKLYSAEKLDPAAIGKVHDNLAKLQRQALEARINAENKSLDLLTSEQKAQLRRGRGWGMRDY